MSRAGPPLPPADLVRRNPLVTTLSRGSLLHRFHSKPHAPIHFDRSQGGRFNAPDGQYGVLYAATAREGAFAETFLRVPGRTLISLELVKAKAYAQISVSRPVRIIRLAGPGLARVGATAEVCHTSQSYGVPQAWSRALHDHPLAADGIAYSARHDDQAECIALFDRSADALNVARHQRDIDQDWFWQLAEQYGIGLAPA